MKKFKLKLIFCMIYISITAVLFFSSSNYVDKAMYLLNTSIAYPLLAIGAIVFMLIGFSYLSAGVMFGSIICWLLEILTVRNAWNEVNMHGLILGLCIMFGVIGLMLQLADFIINTAERHADRDYYGKPTKKIKKVEPIDKGEELQKWWGNEE